MKKRKKGKIILLVLLFISFLIILLGGLTYYTAKNMSFWVGLGAALQNSFETLLFNPILSIQDIVDDQAYWDAMTGDQIISFWLFSFANVIIPLLDILFACSLLDDFLHFFVGLSLKKNRVLIVGYNEQVQNLLHAGSKTNKLYLWTDEELTPEEERTLFLQRIVVKSGEYALNDQVGQLPFSEKKTDRFDTFLRQNKITHVVLLDDLDTKNIEYYLALSACPESKKRTIHFYVNTDIFENRNVMQDLFDFRFEAELEANEQLKNPVEDTHMDLRIFNLTEIQAKVLFQKLPLHTGLENSKKKDIHLLILGGGQMGYSIINHAFNQGVLTADNEILIDVFDKDISGIRYRLEDSLSKQYVRREGTDIFYIPSELADGSLRIRLHEKDLMDLDIVEKLEELQTEKLQTEKQQTEKQGGEEVSKPFTYVAVCVPDEEMNMHCSVLLSKISTPEGGIPVAFRMTYLEQMKIYFESLPYCSHTFLMGSNAEYIDLDQIINKEEEKQIRRHNMLYNDITSGKLFPKKKDGQAQTTNAPAANTQATNAPAANTQATNAPAANTQATNALAAKIQKADDRAPEVAWNHLVYHKRIQNRSLFYHKEVKNWILQDEAKKTRLQQEMDHFWKQVPPDGSEISDLWYSKLLIATQPEIKASETKDSESKASESKTSGIQADEKEKMLYPELVAFSKMEHRRFVYFLIGEGWELPPQLYEDVMKQCVNGPKESYEKKKACRWHNCLVTWDVLCKMNPSALIYDLMDSPLLYDEKDVHEA